MIKVSTLCCKNGDINIETDENDPEQRKLFAEQIVGLLVKGAFISVTNADGETFRIFGYDAEKNEWLLNPKNNKSAKKESKRKPASKSKVTVVAPISGG